MKISQRHPWVLTAEAAVPIQQTLAQEIITQDQLHSVQYVAGVDVGFEAGVYFCRSSHQPGNRDRLRHALYHQIPPAGDHALGPQTSLQSGDRWRDLMTNWLGQTNWLISSSFCRGSVPHGQSGLLCPTNPCVPDGISTTEHWDGWGQGWPTD